MPDLTANLEAIRRALSTMRCTILSATCVVCEALKALRELEGVDQRIAGLEADRDTFKRQSSEFGIKREGVLGQ
jgi:hypothetical protein